MLLHEDPHKQPYNMSRQELDTLKHSPDLCDQLRMSVERARAERASEVDEERLCHDPEQAWLVANGALTAVSEGMQEQLRRRN